MSAEQKASWAHPAAAVGRGQRPSQKRAGRSWLPRAAARIWRLSHLTVAPWTRRCWWCQLTSAMPRQSVRWLRSRVTLLAKWISGRSEEHTSELQSLMRISYAVFCLKKKKIIIEVMITSYIQSNDKQHETQNKRP